MTKIIHSLDRAQVGLGTFPFSGVFSHVTHREAKKIVDAFIEGGGRYIETAPVYPVRDVQLGDILKNVPRKSLFISTKCVTGADAQGNKIRSGKRKVVMAQCKAERERLGVDCLDLLQAHTVAGDAPIHETARALQALKDEGQVRFIGVSNVRLEQLQEFTDHASVDLVQNRFSFIHRSEHRLIEPYCEEMGIYFNPYQVIERGQLTTKYSSRRAPWPKDDLRYSKHEYEGEAHSTILTWVAEELSPIANDLDTRIEALVLAWTLQQPRVLVPVVGVTKSSQVAELVQASKVSIDDGVKARLDRAYLSLETRIKDHYGLSIDEYRGL